MEHFLRANLHACFAAYASARGVGSATIGKQAAGDWRFFDRIAAGKGFTARKYDEVMQWFSDHWPKGVVWPANVPRPAPDAETVAAAAGAVTAIPEGGVA